jgi:hypothetical protein
MYNFTFYKSIVIEQRAQVMPCTLKVAFYIYLSSHATNSIKLLKHICINVFQKLKTSMIA